MPGTPGNNQTLQISGNSTRYQQIFILIKKMHPQRVMLLGPLGRVCGYRGIYPEYRHPRGRTIPDPNVLAVAGLGPPDPNDLTGTRP